MKIVEAFKHEQLIGETISDFIPWMRLHSEYGSKDGGARTPSMLGAIIMERWKKFFRQKGVPYVVCKNEKGSHCLLKRYEGSVTYADGKRHQEIIGTDLHRGMAQVERDRRMPTGNKLTDQEIIERDPGRLEGMEEIRRFIDPYMSERTFYRRVRPKIDAALLRRKGRIKPGTCRYFTFRSLLKACLVRIGVI